MSRAGSAQPASPTMRAGTPVLAARSPGVLEVCADAAAYFEPFDEHGVADLMAKVEDDASFRAMLRERGAQRAREFSWTRCAQAHVEAYSLALGG